MKKLLVVLFFVTILFSCKNDENEYKNNLIKFKNLIEDINTYFIDSKIDSLQISHYYTEDFVFYSYPAGHKKGVITSKVDYINNFNQMKNMNMSINIAHSIYLPGINEESHDIDGSVRVYYGATISNDTIDVEFSGYQTINFSEGKISTIWEWADYGGVSNQFTK
ncbi:MAG: hypothetical protein HN564_06535 [Flavobacteriales bacterium]|jgi:hypothetical protein|nr:hypothetical protein [Flavobacteriales bacterium]|tara:strand:+ start:5064 stop:5558 length:495 start_codon:yes stop_codon:yes gene_type:complete